MIKKLTILAALLTFGAAAHAQWSANVGWVSDYHFRGIFQSDSSASGGIDFEQNGFYAGVWTGDVDDGLEVDGYFGYGGEANGFGYSIGYTGYFYTGDFDDTYHELNLGGAYGAFSLDVALGRYDNFAGPTLDYTFVSLSAEHNGFYGTIGTFSQDFDGDYLELGYGTTVAEVDLSLAVIFANSDLVGTSDESLVFGISKSFDLQ